MLSSNRSFARGMDFESMVALLLSILQQRHPSVVKVERHPRVPLQNGTFAVPDFELICELPHQIDHRIIECQDRERSSQEIAHKIRNMKSLSSKNRFIFVFKDAGYLSDPLRMALDADGIVYYALPDFGAFLHQLSKTLGAVASTVLNLDLVSTAKAMETFDLSEEITGLFGQQLGPSAATNFKASLNDSTYRKKDEGMLSSPPRRGPFGR